MTTPFTLIPALEDNYSILLEDDAHHALAVDPSESAPVRKVLADKRLSLTCILITHHHGDHIGGVKALKEESGCIVFGPEDKRIPALSQTVCEGEVISWGPYTFRIMEVPGHTKSHIAYFEPTRRWLFCGDTLFGAGCGMLFEGTPELMLRSLSAIKCLPPETLIFCGHEYTEENLSFALALEPGNLSIQRRLISVQKLREKGGYSIPFTLEEELQTNPFLRGTDPALQKALGMEKHSELGVFTKIRSLRDDY